MHSAFAALNFLYSKHLSQKKLQEFSYLQISNVTVFYGVFYSVHCTL